MNTGSSILRPSSLSDSNPCVALYGFSCAATFIMNMNTEMRKGTENQTSGILIRFAARKIFKYIVDNGSNQLKHRVAGKLHMHF